MKVKWKYEIGELIKDDKRELLLTDREYYQAKTQYKKRYRYTCLKCGWQDGWVEESNLNKGNGCACCRGFVVVPGINDIATTNPEIVKYLVNQNNAKQYTRGDRDLLTCKCLDCHLIKEISVQDLIRYGFVCPRCGDGMSYPEKVIYSVLEQLNINFITQLSKKTFAWCQQYYYDFYLLDYKIIIEVNGSQHYKNKMNFYGNKNTYIRQQEIDNTKKNLAINNGIKQEHYIVLDCSVSNIDYIKKSIEDSILKEMFDLTIINYDVCNQYAVSSKAIQVIQYYNQNPKISLTELAKMFHCTRATIRSYLYMGNDSGLCEYDNVKHKKQQVALNGKHNGKAVEILDLNGNSLGKFMSCSSLAQQSMELYGVQFDAVKIAAVCRGVYKTHRNYKFKYINKEDIIYENL